jgi:hypothetical protein
MRDGIVLDEVGSAVLRVGRVMDGGPERPELRAGISI